jgi:hypothetical protein
MLTILTGLLLILHGLVHLLYTGQSLRVFELRPGMTWPDEAWVSSTVLGQQTARLVAGLLLVLAAAGFCIGGIVLLFQQDWWRPVTIGSALFSTALFLIFWDGEFRALDTQGGIGVLINLAILLSMLL